MGQQPYNGLISTWGICACPHLSSRVSPPNQFSDGIWCRFIRLLRQTEMVITSCVLSASRLTMPLSHLTSAASAPCDLCGGYAALRRA
eukprot:1161585-Pelagomonas_calceolata.AAC.18